MALAQSDRLPGGRASVQGRGKMVAAVLRPTELPRRGHLQVTELPGHRAPSRNSLTRCGERELH